MEALRPNDDTGFLESNSPSGYAFDSNRKVQFLQSAERYFEETGNMPNNSEMCKTFQINPNTLYNHLTQDEKFSEAWKALLLKAKWKLESKMYEYAQNKGGYMHMITWLRKEFPAEYNPEQKIIHVSDNGNVKSLLNESKTAIEGEIVPNTPPLIEGT